jgi:hypothetical protein
MNIQSHGGLLVDEGTNSAIGYLYDFQGKGVFSPSGKLEVTKEAADTHNACLAQAEIAGLDKAEVGQCGTLYWSNTKGVTTWTGVKVADYTLNERQTVLTFKRPNGHTFRGRLQKDADCFNFKRIA